MFLFFGINGVKFQKTKILDSDSNCIYDRFNVHNWTLLLDWKLEDHIDNFTGSSSFCHLLFLRYVCRVDSLIFAQGLK
jgi:hypothetical protein